MRFSVISVNDFSPVYRIIWQLTAMLEEAEN